jgi:hypothetical protein
VSLNELKYRLRISRDRRTHPQEFLGCVVEDQIQARRNVFSVVYAGKLIGGIRHTNYRAATR